MLIIIEGPDGAGKSTLVRKLQELIIQRYPGEKVEVLRKRPPTSHPLDEYETPLLTYRPGNGHHIICDRWHWGEWVYPDVLGRKTKADRAVWYHTELFLQSRGAVVVYMTESVDVLQRRITARGDDLIKPSDLPKLVQRYDFVSQTSILPVWGIIPEPRRVVEHAADVERVHIKHRDFVTYVGPRFPDTVMLSDVRNATYEGDQRPAFMPYRSSSGHYLLSHLRRDQLTNTGIINACDVDDLQRFMGLHYVHDVSYVALGRNSYRRAREIGYEVPGAPHPQFVRRFHNAFGDRYAEAIQWAVQGEDMIEWRP